MRSPAINSPICDALSPLVPIPGQIYMGAYQRILNTTARLSLASDVRHHRKSTRVTLNVPVSKIVSSSAIVKLVSGNNQAPASGLNRQIPALSRDLGTPLSLP
jgi:hypothetical protein